VNSNESPGRKNPMSSPGSANRITNTPAAPRVASRLWGSRGFSTESLTGFEDERSFKLLP